MVDSVAVTDELSQRRGLLGQFAMMVLALVAAWLCWQPVPYGWRWGDPGIGEFDQLVVYAKALPGFLVAVTLCIFVSRRTKSLRSYAVLVVSGAAILVFVVSQAADTGAFYVYGGDLRAESARLERGEDRRPVEVRGTRYEPSEFGKDKFPECFLYSGDRFLVWCPNGIVPSFGGTGDRSRGIGGGWFVMY